MEYERLNQRKFDQLRPVRFTPNVVRNAAGSVEIVFGGTRVLCTASIEEKVPHHAQERGIGWLTAEYDMLPASTNTRSIREARKGKLSGRTQEIQRLIGRSLRSVVDLKSLKEHCFWIDCDVLEADGGTRTASITGAYVALVLALKHLNQKKSLWPTLPILSPVAAVSVGIVGGNPLLDLNYIEDSSAQVDMNLVMTEDGRIIEVQATAEGSPFDEAQFKHLHELGKKGIQQLFELQANCIQEAG